MQKYSGAIDEAGSTQPGHHPEKNWEMDGTTSSKLLSPCGKNFPDSGAGNENSTEKELVRKLFLQISGSEKFLIKGFRGFKG